MDITTYARTGWKNGERDENKVTAAFIQEALASQDPGAAFWQPVHALIADEFRRQRKALERAVGAWDDEPAEQPAAHGRYDSQESCGGGDESSPGSMQGTTASGGTAQGNSFDRRLALLKEEVWTITRGKIAWSEVTIPDINATIAHYRATIAGHLVTIEFLESAKRLMNAHGVERLGDVPLGEVATLFPDAA